MSEDNRGAGQDYIETAPEADPDRAREVAEELHELAGAWSELAAHVRATHPENGRDHVAAQLQAVRTAVTQHRDQAVRVRQQAMTATTNEGTRHQVLAMFGDLDGGLRTLVLTIRAHLRQYQPADKGRGKKRRSGGTGVEGDYGEIAVMLDRLAVVTTNTVDALRQFAESTSEANNKLQQTLDTAREVGLDIQGTRIMKPIPPTPPPSPTES